MFAHDHHHIFYVKAGDRIYTIPLTALHTGLRRAQGLGNDGGVEPAGESPFLLDTTVIELPEFLCLDDGALRKLVPVDLASDVALRLVMGGTFALTREALLLWGDYCDSADARLDDGLGTDDALRLACTGQDGDEACE
jgi:hypothetical protein